MGFRLELTGTRPQACWALTTTLGGYPLEVRFPDELRPPVGGLSADGVSPSLPVSKADAPAEAQPGDWELGPSLRT